MDGSTISTTQVGAASYAEMCACRQAFLAAWSAWLAERPAAMDVADEMVGTTQILNDLMRLGRT